MLLRHRTTGWWIQLVTLCVLLLTALALLPYLPGGREERRVAAVVTEYANADRNGNFGAVWDCSSRELRQFHYSVALCLRDDPQVANRIQAECGVSLEELLELPPREMCVIVFDSAHRNYWFGYLPANPIRRLNARYQSPYSDRPTVGEPDGCTINGNRASIYITGMGRCVVVKEEGSWRVDTPISQWHDRKVAVFLPRASSAESIDLVIEIGTDRLDENDLAALRPLIYAFRGPDPAETEVLFDLDPDLTQQDVLRLIDLCMGEGIPGILFTRADEHRPPAGIRVNGIPLRDLAGEPALPLPTGHPALPRVLRIGE